MDDYQKKQKALKDKNAAQKSSNPTILAGIVVCAHCEAKMSAFLHTDRYKLIDGSIREKVQASTAVTSAASICGNVMGRPYIWRNE